MTYAIISLMCLLLMLSIETETGGGRAGERIQQIEVDASQGRNNSRTGN